MRLYKYCDAGGIEIIRSNAIKVSSPSEFNDPFDCNPIPDVKSPTSRDMLKTLVKGASEVWQSASKGVTHPGLPPGTDLKGVLQNYELLLDRRVDDAQEMNKNMMISMDQLALLCLSAQRNNYLMWAHYGDRHRGLVIELESEGIFEIGGDSTVPNRLFQVQYSSGECRRAEG